MTINEEARQNLGEDSFCSSFCREGKIGLLAVFDGCGGSGARTHPCYDGHSEAYMASRLCKLSFFHGFQSYLAQNLTAFDPEKCVAVCTDDCAKVFSQCRPPQNEGRRLISPMIKTLPTTAAVAIVRTMSRNIAIHTAWAGDSRVYVLTAQGLSQLSVDDSDERDPYFTDGMMTNTINADEKPRVNERDYTVSSPAIVFSATDGCFAYYMTPMEFEGVLLGTLLQAGCAAEWESLLKENMAKVAGDDFTMVLAAYGFGTFEKLKQNMAERYQYLKSAYLDQLVDLPQTDTEKRFSLWQTYRAGYIKYLEEDR